MSFITLNHGVSFIFGWTGYPSVEKQGMPFVNIKEGKKTRVIITSQISSSRYPYFRDKVFEQQKMLFVKEHRELREEQRTMVNLGSVLYMQVDVPDTHRIFVDVGLGFHVEFTWQSCCPLMTREPRWGINITFNYTTEMTCEPRAFLGCL
ncbi:uncharacterized protein [Populus alba]|uniref:uncharacterized protein isoform X1 n=1 Tax=Populus alba TaxID=43335 RepID=UPI003CC73B57